MKPGVNHAGSTFGNRVSLVSVGNTGIHIKTTRMHMYDGNFFCGKRVEFFMNNRHWNALQSVVSAQGE